MLAERAADVGGDHPVGEIRLVGGDGVAGIEDTVAVVEPDAAANLIGARLGEDLDAAEAEFVVLGGEGILIDADFADGFLGRQLAAAEAIDINGAAVGSGAGPGERLQGIGEIVGIVGERGQIFAAQHECGGVVIRFHADRCGGLVRDGDLLLGGRQHQLNRQHHVAAGSHVHRFIDRCESGEGDLYVVLPGGQSLKNITSVGLGLRGFRTAFSGKRDVRGGDDPA